jgi:hypothetical protein
MRNVGRAELGLWADQPSEELLTPDPAVVDSSEQTL